MTQSWDKHSHEAAQSRDSTVMRQHSHETAQSRDSTIMRQSSHETAIPYPITRLEIATSYNP